MLHLCCIPFISCVWSLPARFIQPASQAAVMSRSQAYKGVVEADNMHHVVAFTTASLGLTLQHVRTCCCSQVDAPGDWVMVPLLPSLLMRAWLILL